MSRGERPLLVLCGALALSAACASAFVFSGTSLWLDEAYSVLLARSGAEGIFRYLRADLGPPLYYLLLGGWTSLFGEGERALRALSGVLYLVTGGVLGVGAWSLWRRPSGAVLAAALYWSSALAVRHATSARMYALLGLWVSLSLVLWLHALRRPSRRAAATEAVVNTLGLLTQYWFGFVLLAQAVVERALLRGRRPLALSFMAHGLPLGLFLLLWGWALAAQLQSGGSGWIDPVGPWALLSTFLDFYGGGIAVAAFAVFAALILLRRPPGLFGREEWALLAVCLGSVGVPFLLSVFKPVYLVGRYTLVALPPFVLLVAGLLARARPRAALAAVSVLVVVRLLALSGDQLRWARRDETSSSRAAAQRLLAQTPPRTVVLYTGLGSVTLRHYLKEARPQLTFPASLQAHPGWLDSEAEAARGPAALDEARGLLETADPREELWHVHERVDPLAAVMEQALRERRGPPSRVLALPGSFHDTVSVYPAQ